MRGAPGTGRRIALAVTLAVTLLAAAPVAAVAAPSEPIGHSGRWFVDADGKVVVLHGVAVVVGGGFGTSPQPERTAAEVGFGQADAHFLAEQGFNVVRLGMFFRGFSPTAGGYDGDYLSSFVGTERELAKAGIFTLLDFHQDQLAPRYNGRGFPDWFLIDDGAPNGAQPFPQGYFVNPALNRAYDNLWVNAAGPGGIGIRDRFVAGWKRVASTFAGESHLLGYDIFNEPWPGTPWPSCASPAGCPPGGFDQTLLTEFSNAVINGIRSVDAVHLGFYEPNLQFDVGAQTRHGKVDDPNVGMSFHDYCLGAAPGLPSAPDPTGACENVGERLVMQNAEDHSAETGAALIMTEFGDTPDPAIHGRVADSADDFMLSWTDWAYMGSTGQIKRDDAKPPTTDNIDQQRLDPVVRAYPQLVAGTPERYTWRQDPARFELAYRSERAGGSGRFGAGSQTEIFVPRRHLPDGYRVELTGAEVVGQAPASGTFTAQHLRIRSCGAREITVLIAPDAGAPGRCRRGGGSGGGELTPCSLHQRGTPGDDRLRGTAAGDAISGRGGDDRIRGRRGDDCLRGGGGRDRLRGQGGDDLLRGGDGGDKLRGGGGKDRIHAGRGRDSVRGGGGADELRGGTGRDRLRAGAGADRVNVRGGGVDTVRCGRGADVAVVGRRDRVRGCERVRIGSARRRLR